MVAWLALTLGACASMSAPPPQASPSLVVPAEWANANAQAAAGNPSLLRWWQRFDDPLLGQLISQALAANSSVQGAQAALRQAR
ncbi:MAG: TolC family protein, partial [Rhodoferax sp.]